MTTKTRTTTSRTTTSPGRNPIDAAALDRIAHPELPTATTTETRLTSSITKAQDALMRAEAAGDFEWAAMLRATIADLRMKRALAE